MDEKKGKSAHATTVVNTTERSSSEGPAFHVEQPAPATGSARRRPAPLSYDEVARAAEGIDAAGEKVTIARIRQQVGGAAETVTAFLSQWREARRTARTNGGGDGLPDSLRVALLREFGAQREAAQAEMHERLAEQREAASELDIELRGARETIAVQEQSITALRLELAQANEKVAAGEHAIELARQTSAAEVETVTRQHRDLQEKLAATGEELGQVRCRAEVEAGRAKTLAAENERLRTELTQASRKAEDSAHKVAAAEQKAAVASTKLDGQAELLAISREQGQQDRRRISELLAEAKESHERAHAAEETQKQLRHKLDAAHAASTGKETKP